MDRAFPDLISPEEARFPLSTVEEITHRAAGEVASDPVKVSVVIPCLNEAGSIQRCIANALVAFAGEPWHG